MASNGHYATRHVFVAAWYCYACVMELTAGDCLDAVCDDFAGLKRESHSCVMLAGFHVRSIRTYLLHP
jgi:hypothetical protein